MSNLSRHRQSAFAVTLFVLVCLLLIGTALPGFAQVVSSSDVDVSTWPVGQSELQSATATIASTFTLGTVSVVTSGGASDFTLAPNSACAAAVSPLTGTTCTVYFTFAPTAVGKRFGAAWIYDSATPPTLQQIIPLVGTGTGPLAAFSPGTLAPYATTGLAAPQGAAFDGAGNLYIADKGNNEVFMIPSGGGSSTVIAGGGSASCTGATNLIGDGCAANTALLSSPSSVAIDGSGNLYIADTGDNVIRMVTPGTNGLLNGTISTYAGNGTAGYDGVDMEPATTAELSGPTSIVIQESQEGLYIADTGNNAVRRVDMTTLEIETVAGLPGQPAGYGGDGASASAALLNGPTGIYLDSTFPTENVFVADTGNNVIREFQATGGANISTVAGGATAVCGQATDAIGDGCAPTAATLSGPTGVVADEAGNLYISDSGNLVVRVVNPISNTISTYVSGLTSPAGLALDANANLYIADSSLIREYNVSGAPASAPAIAIAFSSVYGQTASQNVSVFNPGNLALSITSISSPALPFVIAPNSTTTCTSSTSLNPGVSCVLGLQFSPTQAGSASPSTVVLADNSLSAATQTINLSGTATKAPLTITVNNASRVVNTANPTFTGTVLGTVNGDILTVTYSTAAVLSSPAGPYQITAVVSGAAAANYSVTVIPGILTVTAMPTYSITTPTNPPTISAGGNTSVTLNLTSTGYIGTVSFTPSVTLNGAASSNLIVTPGTATFTTAGGSANCNVSITASANAANHAPAAPWKSGGAMMLCAVLLGAPFTIRRKRTIAVLLAALAISLAGFLIACGNGSSKSPTTPQTAARVYTVTLTPSGTGTVSNPTNPVSFTVTVQ